MTKIALILIIASLLIGAIFFLMREEPEPVLVKKDLGPYVSSIAFAARDVKKGEVIRAEDIMVRDRDADELPNGAALGSQPIGKRARYGIAKGYMVSQYDLDPYPPGLTTRCVRLVKSVQKGQIITADAIEVCETTSDKLPAAGAVMDTSRAVGKTVKSDMTCGSLLSEMDLYANK